MSSTSGDHHSSPIVDASSCSQTVTALKVLVREGFSAQAEQLADLVADRAGAEATAVRAFAYDLQVMNGRAHTVPEVDLPTARDIHPGRPDEHALPATSMFALTIADREKAAERARALFRSERNQGDVPPSLRVDRALQCRLGGRRGGRRDRLGSHGR